MDAEYKKFLVVKAVETLVRDRVDALAFGSTGESLTEMESKAVTPKKPTSAMQFMVASRVYAVGDECHASWSRSVSQRIGMHSLMRTGRRLPSSRSGTRSGRERGGVASQLH